MITVMTEADKKAFLAKHAPDEKRASGAAMKRCFATVYNRLVTQELENDWMLSALRAKFSDHDEAARLVATGHANLAEENSRGTLGFECCDTAKYSLFVLNPQQERVVGRKSMAIISVFFSCKFAMN